MNPLSLQAKLLWAALVVIAFGAITGMACYKAFELGGAAGRAELADLNKQLAERNLELTLEVQDKERDLKADLAKITGVKNAQIRDIDARLTAALDELRDRADRRDPEHLPEGGGTCAGATGAELARPDAGFLTWFAADKSRLQAGLAECYAKYERLQKALN